MKQKGAWLDIGLVTDRKVQEFIGAHAAVLDSSVAKVGMSDGMRRRLSRSNFIFSGMKAFHELNEAFPSLLDENGDRKSFEQFLNDVRRINSTYNEHYLRKAYSVSTPARSMYPCRTIPLIPSASAIRVL